jgi:hypothetical protein
MGDKVADMRVAVGSRHLLPHERWLVQNVARRNMPARNRYAARMLRDYGSDGATLWTAANASMGLALLVGTVGFGFLVASPTGTVGDAGGWLILVALLFGLLYLLRILQCIRAGRAFRADRANLGH